VLQLIFLTYSGHEQANSCKNSIPVKVAEVKLALKNLLMCHFTVQTE